MEDRDAFLPSAGEINEILAINFLSSVADLLEDPKTPESLQDILIAVLDTHADIFIKLINY